ncbi:hypothetical protein ACHAWF_018093 [Thalassiosira exigua]
MPLPPASLDRGLTYPTSGMSYDSSSSSSGEDFFSSPNANGNGNAKGNHGNGDGDGDGSAQSRGLESMSLDEFQRKLGGCQLGASDRLSASDRNRRSRPPPPVRPPPPPPRAHPVPNRRPPASRPRPEIGRSTKWRSVHNELAEFDDKDVHGKKNQVSLLVESLGESTSYVFGSITCLVLWSCACAYFGAWLEDRAEADPGGRAERWLLHIQNTRVSVSVLGTLFIFTLVFRFNSCYDRWWAARIKWGDIIARCLDLARMNRRLIADQELGERLSRFAVAYAYALKALLRGTSLGTEEGEGENLVKRGILTRKELDAMQRDPCWQPHFCLEMIFAVLVEVHKVPDGAGLTFDATNRIHSEVWQTFDGIVRELSDLAGDTIRIRASGLPASYDGVTTLSFFVFFVLAAFVWAHDIGWMTAVIVGSASFIVLLLIVMGSKMVDPFGYDMVDIPMVRPGDATGRLPCKIASSTSRTPVRPRLQETFCDTIEGEQKHEGTVDMLHPCNDVSLFLTLFHVHRQRKSTRSTNVRATASWRTCSDRSGPAKPTSESR